MLWPTLFSGIVTYVTHIEAVDLGISWYLLGHLEVFWLLEIEEASIGHRAIPIAEGDTIANPQLEGGET